MPDEIKGLQTLSNAIDDTLKDKKFIQEIKERLSSDNISKGWKTTRNIAGVVFSIGMLLTSPICPIVIAPTATMWIGWITLVAGVISGRAQLDKSKVK
jgi:hypothetical protein